MNSTLLTDEVTSALAAFFFAGAGPRHATLTRCFTSCGLADADPYDPDLGTPNKEQRVLAVGAAAKRRPGGAGDRLLEQLLNALRLDGVFEVRSEQAEGPVRALRSALAAQSVTLGDDGRIYRTNPIDLATGGREALDEHLMRLQRNVEDPGALLGGAKDLLESVCKFASIFAFAAVIRGSGERAAKLSRIEFQVPNRSIAPFRRCDNGWVWWTRSD